MTRTGRPRSSLGEVSDAVISLAAAKPVTSIDIANELQISKAAARSVLSRLYSAGYVRDQAVVRVAGVKKPLRQVVTVDHFASRPAQGVATLSTWAHAVRGIGRRIS